MNYKNLLITAVGCLIPIDADKSGWRRDGAALAVHETFRLDER